MTRKQVGFFGGTFDPIHFGHLHVAVQLFERKNLDEILFCPANISPEKEGVSPPVASGKDRYEMVRLAIEGIPHFSITDVEILREGPSYTVDTILQLRTQRPDEDFHLLISEDLFQGLPKWKEQEELFRLATPYVVSRGIGLSVKNQVKIPIMDISSTIVRQRLKEKKYCGHLVPAKVLDYIDKHHLY